MSFNQTIVGLKFERERTPHWIFCVASFETYIVPYYVSGRVIRERSRT